MNKEDELYYISVHGDTPLGFNECDNIQYQEGEEEE